MKLKVYNADGSEFSEKEFSQIPTFDGDKGIRALKDLIVAYQANLRQGNACTKMRGEVSGTGKKPWRQKGTGMARHGSKRSPIWVGGGVAHGPRPRDYTQKINKKVKILGLSRAVFDMASGGDLALIESLVSSEPKTKIFNNKVVNMYPKGSVLLIDEVFDDNVILAARNLPRVFMLDADSVNAWDIVRHQKVLVSEKGFEKLMHRING